MKINTALILCAGLGKRLNPLTLTTPKPLLELNNVTMLENCINMLIKLGVKKLYNFYLIFFLISFQGFLGWYMVQSGLVNNIDVSHFRLSIHLLFGFIILSLIFWNYLSLTNLNE